MSGQSVHMAKWMHALEQVTDRHLVKCPVIISKMYRISEFCEWHLPKYHTSALSQEISLTEDGEFLIIGALVWKIQV